MSFIVTIILTVQMLSALAMIGLILVQHGKGADMGAAFGSGGSGSLFGASGSANFLSRTTAVLAAGLTLQLLPWWGERLQAPVKTLAQLARTHHPDRPIVQWGLHQPSFALYLQRPTPRRAPQPGELALVRVDRLASLRHEGDGSPAAALRVLARARGYLLIERPGHDAPETAP